VRFGRVRDRAPVALFIQRTLLALWLALIAALLGRYAWQLDLFTHFRVHLAVGFAVCCLVLLIARRGPVALLAAVGTLLSAAPMLEYWSPPWSHAQAQPASFRLVTFNIWYRAYEPVRIASLLEQVKADAVVLQEISTRQALELRTRLPSYPYSYLEAGMSGAVVYAKWPIRRAQVIDLARTGVPAAQVVLDWQGTPVTVIGAHLDWPIGTQNWRLRNAQLQALGTLAAMESGPLLITGDFNVTPWSPYFRRLVERAGLRDCAAGQGIAASWPARLSWIGIRIDHCLASRHWRSVDVSVGPRLGSDHLPVIAELVLGEQRRAQTAGPRAQSARVPR
jgi:endonuclease/exonuclease/phosphatase (EEP) superfamily protein YafD